MRAILAPAKQMAADDALAPTALPALLGRSERLLAALRALDLPALQKLLGCGEALAQRAFGDFARMEPRRMGTLTPALFAYDGIQYKYMAPGVFTDRQLAWAQRHVRILSGFYGVLRPLDGVAPHRLEMQAPLAVDGARSLYEFWAGALARQVAEEGEGADTVIDLASAEYSRAVMPHLPAGVRRVKCVFAQLIGGKPVEKGVYVKMARGEMVRFLAETEADRPEDLRAFDRLGYRFAPEFSTQTVYVFLGPGRRG